jgi:chromosome segregation ATPase
LSLYAFEIACVEQSPDKCGLGVDTQNVQLQTVLETEKETFRTVRSELEQSLKTSTTQHASLQTQHTEVQKEIVHVKAQYKKCMETNLELLAKLHEAEVHESDGVSQRCSWCVNTTSVK